MNRSPPRRLFGVHTWVLVLFIAIAVFTIGLFASNGAGTAEAATVGPITNDTTELAPTSETALLSAIDVDSVVYSTTSASDVTATAGTSTPAEVDASGGSGEIAILSDVLIIDPTTSQATIFVAAMAIFAATLLTSQIRRLTQHRGRLRASARDGYTIYCEDDDYSPVTSREIGLHTGRVALNSSLFGAFFDRLRGTGPEWTSATLAPT